MNSDCKAIYKVDFMLSTLQNILFFSMFQPSENQNFKAYTEVVGVSRT